MTTMAAILALVAIAGCVALASRLRSLRAELAARASQGDARMRERDAQVREQAAAQERERIYSDLHDDLGAKLLELVYRAESPVQADLTTSTGSSGGSGHARVPRALP